MNSANEELIGHWSAGAGYSDTFSDEWLIFRLDGTGRLIFLNPFDDDSYHFRWQVISPGVIDLIGSSERQTEADNQQSGVGSNEFHFLGVRYNVAEIERPLGMGNRIRVLRLELNMPWPNELGFVSDNYEAAEGCLTPIQSTR